jgi:hypothetical protein
MLHLRSWVFSHPGPDLSISRRLGEPGSNTISSSTVCTGSDAGIEENHERITKLNF